MQGKYSITKLHPQPYIFFAVYVEIGSPEITQADSELTL